MRLDDKFWDELLVRMLMMLVHRQLRGCLSVPSSLVLPFSWPAVKSHCHFAGVQSFDCFVICNYMRLKQAS